ncbi:MAG: tRNA (guanosine(46)-N7)-methyltransferase TrmB [Halobacteriovoraceae bacterium]|nr:tRNA (guanosine(46)-N7)-methyltransferase TrmB [Halobacteriovoraceae bacterium]
MDKTLSQDFKYTHKSRNPYHDKLEQYKHIVMRDEEAELYQGKWNEVIFNRDAPLYLEIGSGYGHFMVEFCSKYPDVNFVGMDYRFKRSFELARRLDRNVNEIYNFRYLRAKGERTGHIFGENELDGIFYFFPDPWPKARHNKKRLFKNEVLPYLHRTLKPEGKIYIKTDHDGYAEQMAEVIDNSNLFKLQFKTHDLWKDAPEHFLASFSTKFEKIFLAQKVNIKAFEISAIK